MGVWGGGGLGVGPVLEHLWSIEDYLDLGPRNLGYSLHSLNYMYLCFTSIPLLISLGTLFLLPKQIGSDKFFENSKYLCVFKVHIISAYSCGKRLIEIAFF